MCIVVERCPSHKKRVSQQGAVSGKRCDYFNLIVGTGTRGISAFFLPCLRMTVDNQFSYQPPTIMRVPLLCWTHQCKRQARPLKACAEPIVIRFFFSLHCRRRAGQRIRLRLLECSTTNGRVILKPLSTAVLYLFSQEE
ncbi:hypothetical protein JB92DRAFT_1389495 [Gautieria morchelliformis]|nr:hypothetical protein JB92DRAFT_1389495 [Gautieria morchelliformis]